MKTCTYCGEDHFVHCPECGTALAFVPAPEPGTKPCHSANDLIDYLGFTVVAGKGD